MHPESEGQTNQDGEGERSQLHSNQRGHRRKTVNKNLRWGPSPLVPGYRGWESRVSAKERLEGCIAEAVALAPWLRDGRSREGWRMCGVSQRDKTHSWANHILGLPAPSLR